MKGASLPQRTLNPEHTTVPGNDRFAEGQAQAESIDLAREPGIHAVKTLENVSQVFRGNAPALIAYLDFQYCFVLSKGAGQNECHMGTGPWR